jgi:hypothetical protein
VLVRPSTPAHSSHMSDVAPMQTGLG